MPFVEVFTREELSDDIRRKLAEELSNTIMTVELGGPTESAKMIELDVVSYHAGRQLGGWRPL